MKRTKWKSNWVIDFAFIHRTEPEWNRSDSLGIMKFWG